MKLFIIALLSTVMVLPSIWFTNLESAKKEAKQQNKLILLNFSGSDWCAPCIKMKKNYFETAIFQQYANDKLVLLKADFPRLKKNALPAEQQKTNEQLAEKYNLKGTFPCTVLMNAEGKILKRWEGYPTEKPVVFLQQIEQFYHANK
jgi:thioredoxin-related protein